MMAEARFALAVAIGGAAALALGLPLAWEIDRRMQPELMAPEFVWPEEDVYPPEHEHQPAPMREPAAMTGEEADHGFHPNHGR